MWVPRAKAGSCWMSGASREGRFLLTWMSDLSHNVTSCWARVSRDVLQVLVGCWVSYDIGFLLDLGYLACCTRFLLDNPGSHMQWYVFVESQTTNCGVHSGIQYCVSKLVIIEVAQSVL